MGGNETELLYEIIFNCLTFSLPNFSFRGNPGELSRGIFLRVLFPGK